MNRGENWTKHPNRSRVSRRRFVGGAASVGAGVAGLLLVGCGDDDDVDDQPTATASAIGTPVSTPGHTEGANAAQPGGVWRTSTAGNAWDTFDSDRTTFAPIARLLNLTHDGFLSIRDFATNQLEGELAESWEVADDTTIVFKLRPNAVWDDKPPVHGRAVTIDDLANHIVRNKEAKLVDGSPGDRFNRSLSYQTVDKVEATDAETLTVTFTRPDPFFLVVTLASPYARVLAPEAIEAFEPAFDDLTVDTVIGTGAFVLESFDPSGDVSYRRNPHYWGQPAWLDRIVASNLITDQATAQTAWELKQIEGVLPASSEARDELIQRHEGEVYTTRAVSASPHGGGYYGGAAPWNNPNLAGALFRILDRRLILQQLLGGAGVLAANVPPTQAAYALPEEELVQYPGYLEDHARDVAEAKAMWEAGGGPALGPITMDVADIWEGRYRGVIASLQSIYSELGNEIVPRIESYTTIFEKINGAQYGSGNAAFWHGWMSEVKNPDATLDVYTLYNSKGGAFFTNGVKIDEVDQWTDEAIVEYDSDKRIDLIKNATRKILENNGASVPYIQLGLTSTLYWNYAKTGRGTAFVDEQNHHLDRWFDKTDPTWQGRPA